SSTKFREPRVDQHLAMAAMSARDEGNLFLIPGAFERIELRDELRERLIPRDHRERAVASRSAAFQRLRDAIGVIRDLNRGLPSGAETAFIDRMGAVAFELLGNPHADHALLSVLRRLDVRFHDADAETAAAGAHRAYARFPFRNAWNQLLFRHEAD